MTAMTLAQRILGETKQYRSQRVIVGEVEGDVSGASVKATGGSIFSTLADWMADVGRVDRQDAGGFWTDIGSTAVEVHRLRDRLFIGQHAGAEAKRTSAAFDWLTGNGSTGPNWMPRDSDLSVMSAVGGLAISGISRSSDTGGTASLSTWGVGGYGLADRAGSTARGVYAEAVLDGGAAVYALEAVTKNKGANTLSSPYSVLDGARGIMVVAGGDDSYGGAAANHSDTGLAFFKGSKSWNRGIVFNADALSDGGSSGVGVGVAMALGERQGLFWYESGGATAAASIYSQINAASHAVSIVFANDEILLRGESAAQIFRVSHQTNGVNYLQVKNAATGGAPSIGAGLSSDTNVDIAFTPKGTGVLRFGTHSALGAETVTGFITIKDAAGNSRKLAVVS